MLIGTYPGQLYSSYITSLLGFVRCGMGMSDVGQASGDTVKDQPREALLPQGKIRTCYGGECRLAVFFRWNNSALPS